MKRFHFWKWKEPCKPLVAWILMTFPSWVRIWLYASAQQMLQQPVSSQVTSNLGTSFSNVTAWPQQWVIGLEMLPTASSPSACPPRSGSSTSEVSSQQTNIAAPSSITGRSTEDKPSQRQNKFSDTAHRSLKLSFLTTQADQEPLDTSSQATGTRCSLR